MDVERKPDAAVLHVFVHLFVLCPKACVLQVCAQRLQIMTCCKRMCWRSFGTITMRLKLQKQADFLNVGLAHHLDSDSFNVVPCGHVKWSVGTMIFLVFKDFIQLMEYQKSPCYSMLRTQKNQHNLRLWGAAASRTATAVKMTLFPSSSPIESKSQ